MARSSVYSCVHVFLMTYLRCKGTARTRRCAVQHTVAVKYEKHEKREHRLKWRSHKITLGFTSAAAATVWLQALRDAAAAAERDAPASPPPLSGSMRGEASVAGDAGSMHGRRASFFSAEVRRRRRIGVL